MSWQSAVLSAALRRWVKPLSRREFDIARFRALYDKPYFPPPLPRGWRFRESSAPTGEWIERRDGDTGPVILYLHGGAYIYCTPRTLRPITVTLARQAGARLFAPKYRRAPEDPYPAALEDALAAYRHLLDLGIAPGRLVVAGDSAGGGLALALLLALKEAGEPLPAGAVLFCPWTDLAATGESLVANDARDPVIHGDAPARGARYYLNGASPTDPLASPLYGDLAGLPPLFIQVSDAEVLFDDSARVAAKAQAAGVAVDFRAWSGLPHVWHYFVIFLPEARAALREAAAFIRARSA